MNGKKIFKIAVVMSIIGLAMLLVCAFSGIAYPNALFKIFLPVGMLLLFISLGTGFVGWIFMVKSAIIAKDHRWAGSLLLIGAIIILIEFFRLLFR